MSKDEGLTGEMLGRIERLERSRLTDNEVVEVAKMQKHIDNLELYSRILYLTLKGEQAPKYVESEGTSQSWEFENVLEFLKFIRTDYPCAFDAFNERKERQWQQEQTRRRQEKIATKPTPFWKRLAGVFLHPLSGH